MTLDQAIDSIQEYMVKQGWYKDVSLSDRLELWEFIVEKLDNVQTPTERVLYNACQYALQHICGSGSEQAELDCIHVLQNALEYVNEKENKDGIH